MISKFLLHLQPHRSYLIFLFSVPLIKDSGIVACPRARLIMIIPSLFPLILIVIRWCVLDTAYAKVMS